MTNINATNFRVNAFEYFNLTIAHNDVITVSTRNSNSVLMNKRTTTD